MIEKRLLEQNLLETCKRLLKTRAYDVLEEIADRGFKLNEKHEWTSQSSSLTRQEFVHLVDKLPGKREDTDRGDGSVPVPPGQEHNLQSFTLRVASRKIRNGSLDSWEAIHIVASGTHWWHAGAIRYLAQQGSNLNEMDEWRGTPLHVAVKGGHRRFETAKALLELGADPNLLHKDRTAPLARAIGDGEMTRLLLQYGADFEASNLSVYYDAVCRGDEDLVQAILETGVDPNMPFCEDAPATYDDKRKEVSMRRSGPIEQGLRSRLLHLVALSGGANDNIRDGGIKVIQVLLEYGADPLLPIDGNTTIIHYCLCYRAIVQPFLAVPGLDVEYRDGGAGYCF
ncbi:ankyrin repeat-containing domain protein [Aspergillus pseudoustus]|uniref:Ankyrin repeat-containing domain protein n=1 Tax=Aspergillus pseudoustus TaxID=1810923 RepID=A0ABR4KGZ9_9EURO